MRLTGMPAAVLVWRNMRRIRRASDHFRRAEFYTARGLRTKIVFGLAPLAVTPSGVTAIPRPPSFSRR